MATSNFKFDIIASQIAKRIIRSILFPYALQLLTLIVFIALVVNGFLTGTDASYGTNLTPIIRKTNLTTLLVWGMWWPGLILTTIVLGRIWCTVCPMEFVSNLANRTAGRFSINGIRLSAWLRSGYIILLSYVVLQLMVAGFQVHRTPLYSSYVLLGLLSLSLLIGFLFKEPRAFCKGFCPASLLLNTYSFLNPVKLMKNNDDICIQCDTKDCVLKENRDKFDARSCPSYLRPFDLTKYDSCVICFQCAKVCPKDNIGFGVVNSSLQHKIGKSVSFASALFIFIASGFVSHELFAETSGLDDVFHLAPKWLSERFGMPSLFPWFEALWFLLILPTVFFCLVWGTSFFSKIRYSFVEFITRIALYLVPVLAAGHAMKAIIKINSWSLYLPFAISDPIGIRTAKKFVSGNMQAIQPVFPDILTFVFAALLLICSVIVARKMVRERLERDFHPTAYIGISVLVCLYSVVILNLISQ
ncbi:MAG: 4Fe-4S binding protein [Nitrospinae bacterium]|nr:4Fe-4S binding protein [Nitrospinota bacterium]